MNGRRSPKFHVLAILVSLFLIGAAMWAVFATAADPDKGTVSLSDSMTGWNGRSYPAGASVAGCPGRGADPANAACDYFTLTVDIPKAHWNTNTGGVEVQIAPDAQENADFDMRVYDKNGDRVGEPAINAGTTNERVFISRANSEDGPYEVEVQPYTVVNSAYKGGARVESRADTTGGEIPTEPQSNVKCENDKAGVFPCSGIDMAGFLPLGSLAVGGADAATELNDIWGWTDQSTGREYALVGKTNGTAFVDVTNPSAPAFLGQLPSAQQNPVTSEPEETIFNLWRDIKVYKNHAFIVSEEPTHGMQVFNLTKLRGLSGDPKTFEADGNYSYVKDGPASLLDSPEAVAGRNREPLFTLDNAHNITINEDSGFAYAIGTSTCAGGGSHIIDIKDPKNPRFAGCDAQDSYTHDNQCVNYTGPDADHTGKEICFNSNEDTVTIVDVSDKSAPEMLARVPYDTAIYTHQNWLNPEQTRLLVDDELDENDGGLPKTTTYVYNVEDLDNPVLLNSHEGETESIDHNQYVRGNRSFQANYRSGLRVLDTSGIGAGNLSEVGFFDVFPEDDAAEFNGSWSNYPYFDSGTVVVSGIEQGLFVLKPSSEVAGTFKAGTGTGRTGTTEEAKVTPEDEAASAIVKPGTGTGGSGSGSGDSGTSAGAPRKRLRAGFGRHSYGRVKRGAFRVQCRVRGRGTRVCTIIARHKASGRFRTIGRGSARLRGRRRAVNVRVKLNKAGRRLVSRRPRGSRIRLVLRARDLSGRTARNRRAGKLRATRRARLRRAG